MTPTRDPMAMPRDLLVPHGWRGIDKTDGFLLLFETAKDALGLGCHYRRVGMPFGCLAANFAGVR